MKRDNELKITKATSKTARRIARKHRVSCVKYCWFPVADSRGLIIGNSLFGPTTRREERRFRGMVPELMAAVRKTAVASGYKGPIVLAR